MHKEVIQQYVYISVNATLRRKIFMRQQIINDNCVENCDNFVSKVSFFHANTTHARIHTKNCHYTRKAKLVYYYMCVHEIILIVHTYKYIFKCGNTCNLHINIHIYLSNCISVCKYFLHQQTR